MSVVGKPLIAVKVLTTVATDSSYTATNVRTRIDKMAAENFSAGAVTFSVYKIPSGGSAGNSTLIINAHSLNVGETYTCPELTGAWLANGDKVQAIASGNTTVTFYMDGIEVSGT